jgi:drug/metabolite transporter (DMT)-like permease
VYVALVVASFLWGSLYPASKPAVAAVGPVQVVFIRALMACLTLGTIVILRGNLRGIGAQLKGRWLGILGISFLSFSFSAVLAMIAAGMLPASVNGLLNNTHPLWLAIGTALFFAPRRPALLVGGSLIALAGVGLVLFPDLSSTSVLTSSALNPKGVVISLAGSGVIALSNVVGRQVMRRGDPIVISAVASGLAVPVLAAISMATGGLAPILAATLPEKLLLIYVGIGCTALNFSLWFYALQFLPGAQAAAFQYLIPPISVVVAAAFLGEPLTTGLVFGGALILVGLIATQASATDRTPKHQPADTSSIAARSASEGISR